MIIPRQNRRAPSFEREKYGTAAMNPGLVHSRLGARADLPIAVKALVEFYAALGGRMDADTGSWTSVFCAAGQDFMKPQSGTYFQQIAEAGGRAV